MHRIIFRDWVTHSDYFFFNPLCQRLIRNNTPPGLPAEMLFYGRLPLTLVKAIC